METKKVLTRDEARGIFKNVFLAIVNDQEKLSSLIERRDGQLISYLESYKDKEGVDYSLYLVLSGNHISIADCSASDKITRDDELPNLWTHYCRFSFFLTDSNNVKLQFPFGNPYLVDNNLLYYFHLISKELRRIQMFT